MSELDILRTKIRITGEHVRHNLQLALELQPSPEVTRLLEECEGLMDQISVAVLINNSEQ